MPLAAGDLRIVTYNVLGFDGQTSSNLGPVLQAIGLNEVNNFARPIDVLALQEVRNQQTTTQSVVNQLNAIYGANAYARGQLNGTATSSNETVGLVYNTRTIQLINESGVGTHSTSGAPRQPIRYQLRPRELGPGNDFYLYNSHYKASDSSGDRARRQQEALAIKSDANALGEGALVIFAGDFNVYSSTEASYQTLLAAGNARARDPINKPGNWSDNTNVSFREVFTQAPLRNAPSGFVGNGLDDRFDFQLLTDEWFDGAGLEYRPGSYRAFGNNGSVPVNESINISANTALPDLSNRTTILNLLTTVSDHLPVVVDYQYINSVPTAITLSASTINENLVAGTVIGNFTTTDADAGDTFTYSLVSGTGSIDNGQFSIIANQLRSASAFNFEAKSSYSIRVRTTDRSNAIFDRVFTIQVLDINEPPTSLSLSNLSLAENLAAPTLVGFLSATDPDAISTITYSFITGAGSEDNARFSIAGNQLFATSSFDFESKGSYNIRLVVADQSGLSFDRAIVISILDVNEIPTADAGGPYSAQPSQVFNLLGSGADPDMGQSLTYEWDLDYDGVQFDVSALGVSPAVSYAATGIFTIALRVRDNAVPQLSAISMTSITVAGPPPKVTGVVFGDGTRNRSIVNRIDVAFDAKTTLAPGAFSLERRVNGSFVAIPPSQVTITVSDIGSASSTLARLTFSGTGVINGSLSDGNYRLTVNAPLVRANGVDLDGDNNGQAGGNFVMGSRPEDEFFRLYADTNGDRVLGVTEFLQFRNTYNKPIGGSGYNPLFDFDGGGVGVTDFLQFRSRYGKPAFPF